MQTGDFVKEAEARAKKRAAELRASMDVSVD
jgi:hypothetical protein